ncbi:YceI family protein [Saccharomonospora sp. NPDC006951]
MASDEPAPALVRVPSEGDYAIDPRRSSVSFSTRQFFGLLPVRGTFALVEGSIHVARPVRASSAAATVSSASLDTRNPPRDWAIRSPAYLDTSAFPVISFTSTALEEVAGTWVLRGGLTARGVTRPLDVRIERAGPAGSRWDLLATGTVDRFEFGITAMRGMAGRSLDLRLHLVTAAR